jgi:4-amino-4-deoxy-L-arabinose transferase-like glycosyltransferase
LNFDFFPSDRKNNHNLLPIPSLVIILAIWLVSAICDRVWYGLDNSVPTWDPADYLNGALNYWNALQNPQWLDGEWWRSLWLLSNKIPPLHYIVTTPFLTVFGLTEDAASLVMLFYSAILLVSVSGLGGILFNRQVGIYAAILCQLLPGLYYYRLEFLLDYPLTAITILSFWLLTLWKVKANKSWLRAVVFGMSLGLAILLKQTALFFLFIPLLWLAIAYIKSRQWLRIWQLMTAIFIAIAICYPWYRTNWLLILTSGKRATLDSAIAEGDPALNSMDAWFYYFKTLPYLISWHLLLIPIVGLLLYLISRFFKVQFYVGSALKFNDRYAIGWLLIYLLGGYFLSSFNINKDTRYVLPLLPIIALLLTVGLLSYSQRWRNYLGWLTIGLSIALMLLNIFPLPGANLAQILSPRTQHYPYLGQPYPHQEIVREIIKTTPYLRTTLGVLQNFQVVGRQVGIKENEVVQDLQSLNWFITKTGTQGSVPEAQAMITKLVSESKNFRLHKSWQLPDRSEVKLYHKIKPDVEVSMASKKPYLDNKVQLNKIQLPAKTRSGRVIPVTYQWTGTGKQLSEGIVLLTWMLKPQQVLSNYPENKSLANTIWLSDRGIGMGMLANNYLNTLGNSQDKNVTFQVIENTAMLVPKNIISGQYKLQATYLNRETKESYNIPISDTTITVDRETQPALTTELDRELDLVTQLRIASPTIASGIKALEPIFTQTARINQYDAKQDYLQQTEISLSYRLKNNQGTTQQKLDWNYAVALSQVLQQDVRGAISSWQKIIKLEPNNPYNYAYLAFVYLYNWQPKLATTALDRAEAINQNIPEITTLQGVAALMQGNLIKAWKLLV